MRNEGELIAAARAARANACARWSGFHVGAALLTCDGRIYTGVNVECSSYGGTICAERTALVKALSEGEREFVAIAVATSSAGPVMPCGICRQLLFDYAREVVVIAVGESEVVRVTLRELLPFGFEGPV
jgi:cytidine deaminase